MKMFDIKWFLRPLLTTRRSCVTILSEDSNRER